VALAELHHLIEKENRAPQIGARFFSSNRTRGANMPLLFYLPLIIWMGLFEAAQDEMRAPVKVIKAYRRLDNDRTR
jgi:hypothetical protein